MEGHFIKILKDIQDDLIVELNLYASKFGEEHIGYLIKELERNKSVKVVSLLFCNLRSPFASVLGDVLKTNERVTDLDLYGNELGDEGARLIAEALKVNQSLKSLTLSCNSISAKGARDIAEAMKTNQSIKKLFLDTNNFCCKGARDIAEAMKMNYSVRTLFLHCNSIGSVGAQSLLDAAKSNGSLIEFQFHHEYGSETSAICERNISMYKRAQESVIHLLALRSMRRILWIPKEMMVMIGQMLWRTKFDVDAWNK